MNYLNAIRSGFIVWILLIITFTIFSSIPGIQDSTLQQTLVVTIFMVGYATMGAALYYKKGVHHHGIKVGLIISATALILDVLITVPFLEIPAGRSYLSFFSSPLLWMLVLVNLVTIYLYWVLRVRRKLQ
ncbi:MAG: hypothetical protein EBR30_05665 [Cytophagia bacterium]|nr:hypothetical protein [Cytophagia bacterium]NBW34499.1 hypothetical protein [Cytophagia bacterium]